MLLYFVFAFFLAILLTNPPPTSSYLPPPVSRQSSLSAGLSTRAASATLVPHLAAEAGREEEAREALRGLNFTRRSLSSNKPDGDLDFIDGLREAVASEVAEGASGLSGAAGAAGMDINELISEAIDEEFERAAEKIKEAAMEIAAEESADITRPGRDDVMNKLIEDDERRLREGEESVRKLVDRVEREKSTVADAIKEVRSREEHGKIDGARHLVPNIGSRESRSDTGPCLSAVTPLLLTLSPPLLIAAGGCTDKDERYPRSKGGELQGATRGEAGGGNGGVAFRG